MLNQKNQSIQILRCISLLFLPETYDKIIDGSQADCIG